MITVTSLLMSSGDTPFDRDWETNVPDKDGSHDHFNDALGYLVEYNFPVRRDFKPNPLQRWS